MVYYQTKKIITLIILHTFLFTVAMSCLFPFLWMINTSFKTQSEYDQDSGLRIAQAFTWQNYKEVLVEAEFWRYLINSVVYTFITVIFIVLIASLAAFGFSRLKFPGRNVIFFIFLAAMMIPLPAGFVPIYALLQQFGLLNRVGYLLAMTNIGLSISIYLLKTFFDQLPRDLEDAACIDGCSKLQIWWHVALPLVSPALGVVIIFNALNVWNEFVLAKLIFSDDKFMPLQAGLMEFTGRMVTQHTLIMAALTMAAVPIILLYIRMQKQFIKGLTAGATVG